MRAGGSAQRSRAEHGGRGRTAGPRPLLPRSRAERSAGAGDARTGLWSSDGGQAEEARGRGVPYNPPRVWDLRAGRVCWDGAGLQGLTRYRDPERKRGARHVRKGRRKGAQRPGGRLTRVQARSSSRWALQTAPSEKMEKAARALAGAAPSPPPRPVHATPPRRSPRDWELGLGDQVVSLPPLLGDVDEVPVSLDLQHCPCAGVLQKLQELAERVS